MKTNIVRIGIVGVGRMGRRHAENLALRVPGAELVAACSPLTEELDWARDALGVRGLYKEYAELLAHPGLDAVFLVTPTRCTRGRSSPRFAPGSTCSAKSRCRWFLRNAWKSRRKPQGIRSSR